MYCSVRLFKCVFNISSDCLFFPCFSHKWRRTDFRVKAVRLLWFNNTQSVKPEKPESLFQMIPAHGHDFQQIQQRLKVDFPSLPVPVATGSIHQDFRGFFPQELTLKIFRSHLNKAWWCVKLHNFVIGLLNLTADCCLMINIIIVISTAGVPVDSNLLQCLRYCLCSWALC